MIMSSADLNTWREKFSQLADPHILQTEEWGYLKSAFGWKVDWIFIQNQPVQILFRLLPLGFKIAYLPKPRLILNDPGLIKEFDKICRGQRVIFLKIEPDHFEEDGSEAAISDKWKIGRAIQPRRTILVDISGSEDQWLERMKQKTRYNIKLAVKKGVSVVESDDLDQFYAMIEETAEREKFGIHTKSYYQKAYQLFAKKDQVALLIASYEGIPLAGLMVFRIGKRAWYFYGASNNLERNRMPTYLLQFEAMRWAKSKGCEIYDLWGIPDEDESTLERDFESRSDGLWGVYRFKRGFGGVVHRSSPAYDRVYNPILYELIRFVQKTRGDLL